MRPRASYLHIRNPEGQFIPPSCIIQSKALASLFNHDRGKMNSPLFLYPNPNGRIRESGGIFTNFMSQAQTLISIFEETKGELKNSLSGLVLPKDSDKVQSIITEYLNTVCDEESDYRQNLTQSEDYILQAALSMLNAQRGLVAAFDRTPDNTAVPVVAHELDSIEKPETRTLNPKKNPFNDVKADARTSLIGAGGGALVGKLILGGWGAVFGAVAGTAVALYLSQKSNASTDSCFSSNSDSNKVNEVNDTPVDTSLLLGVIANICESLDNLIATFRAQVKRVVNKYESQEKPTIEREYRTLLEGIQSLIGYKRGHSPEEEKYLSKLQTRVEDLAELLDNYDLEAVDFTPEHSDWFEAIESKNTTVIKMVSPAVVKNGVLVLKGKIFTPVD